MKGRDLARVRVEGEGSTCPSRGKLWLTVYRAHASRKFADKMTFRAFLALRVIRMQWKSSRNEVVKKIESSRTKSKISQNLNWELDTGAIVRPCLGPKVP